MAKTVYLLIVFIAALSCWPGGPAIFAQDDGAAAEPAETPAAPTPAELLEQARALEKEKKYEEAIAIYEQLRKDAPDSTTYLFALGKLYSWTHNWDRAMEALNRCLEIAPDHHDARIALGYLYLWTDRIDDAEACFRAVLDKRPAYTDALIAYGRILFRKSEHEPAKTIFAQVLEQNPNHIDALNYMGRLSHREQRYKEARAYYGRALAIEPDDSVALQWMSDTRHYTDPSFEWNSRYSREREEDQDTDKQVTELSSFSNALDVRLPLPDRWIFTIGASHRTQKERSLRFKRDNYDVDVLRLELGAEFRWLEILTLSAGVGFQEVDDEDGSNRYPFERETKVEPKLGLTLEYADHVVSLRASQNSFVAKNFDLDKSELLEQKNAGISWMYTLPTGQRVGASFARRWIGGDVSNRVNDLSVWLNSDLPILRDVLSATYTFDLTDFDRDVPVYYSYDRQIKHSIKFTARKQFDEFTRLEASWTKSWQRTTESVNPDRQAVDMAVFLDDSTVKRAAGDKISISFNKRFGYSVDCELSASYYWNSNEYETLGFALLFSWQF